MATRAAGRSQDRAKEAEEMARLMLPTPIETFPGECCVIEPRADINKWCDKTRSGIRSVRRQAAGGGQIGGVSGWWGQYGGARGWRGMATPGSRGGLT